MEAKYRVLHNDTTEPGTGLTAFVSGSDEAAVVISGTSTDFQAKFQVSLDGDNWVDTVAYRTDNPDLSATVSTSMNYGWDIDVARWNYLRVNLTSITNGNVTVKCGLSELD